MQALRYAAQGFLACSPGARRTLQTTMVTSRRTAYMILEEVEFLQDGQAAQHREKAAEPQQQARAPTDIRAPILDDGLAVGGGSQQFFFFLQRLLTQIEYVSHCQLFFFSFYSLCRNQCCQVLVMIKCQIPGQVMPNL